MPPQTGRGRSRGRGGGAGAGRGPARRTEEDDTRATATAAAGPSRPSTTAGKTAPGTPSTRGQRKSGGVTRGGKRPPGTGRPSDVQRMSYLEANGNNLVQLKLRIFVLTHCQRATQPPPAADAATNPAPSHSKKSAATSAHTTSFSENYHLRASCAKSLWTFSPQMWAPNSDGNPTPFKHCRKPPKPFWCTFSRTRICARCMRNGSRSCRRIFSSRGGFEGCGAGWVESIMAVSRDISESLFLRPFSFSSG